MTNLSEVEIPTWVIDLNSYRRWVHSVAVPEDAKVFWFDGKVWVEMSKEQLFSHYYVKLEIARVLANLAIEIDLGRMGPDGALLTNDDANLGVNPDGIFISHEAREHGRVELVRGGEGGHVEIRGTPDMILEVVSKSSVTKDTTRLFEAYWKAGIPEYWLVDARRSPARFVIYRHTEDGYLPARGRGGWLKSVVFDRQFRFVELKDRFGDAEYRLEMR
jgi:Uma2 family endonuclease